MDNKKIPTWLGTIILLIIAITVGAFVWKVEKNQPYISQPQYVTNTKKPAVTQMPTVVQQNQQQDFLIVKPTLPINQSKWKVLTNKSAGFSIQYPPEFFIDNESDAIYNYKPKDPLITLQEGVEPEGGVSLGISKLTYPVYPVKLPTKADFINNLKNLNDPAGLTENAQNVKVGKYIILSNHIKGGPGGELREYFAFTNNNIYTITISEPGYSEYKDLIDKILATFTLIDIK